MNAEWRRNWNKLTVGGCGTQIGMFLSCGIISGLVLFCAVCAVSSVLSITAYDMARTLLQPTSTEMITVAAIDLTPAPATLEATSSLIYPTAAVVSAASSLPVTMLPETGELVVIPSPPKPIVTATEGRVNLRSGPGTAYERVAILPANASLEIVGRNRDTTWWLVSTTEGLLWVSGSVVTATNLDDSIPIVDITVPPKSALPQSVGEPAAVQATPTPGTAKSPQASVVSSTPTAGPNQERIFVEDTVGYKRLWVHLSYAPLSTSFSPKGDQIAITEGVKIHIVAGDGSYGRVLLMEDEIQRPVGQLVWSPDGHYLAFTVDKKKRGCKPCRVVGIIRLSDEAITYLNTPDQMDSDAPRWTQGGRLLVNVYPVEPADGTTFVYNTAGQGQPAAGIYTLSSSHEGQKFLPWYPGRTWQAGISERPDTYYND